jgi:hypothetical protein
MGRKVSDRFTVPLCRLHHRELHRRGNERAWWQIHTIDPLAVAARLWAMTHVPEGAEAGLEGETVSTHPKLDRRRWVSNGVRLSGPLQNDETNPILWPEAE